MYTSKYNTADIDMFHTELWQCLYNNLFLFNTKNTLKYVPPKICDLTTNGDNQRTAGMAVCTNSKNTDSKEKETKPVTPCKELPSKEEDNSPNIKLFNINTITPTKPISSTLLPHQLDCHQTTNYSEQYLETVLFQTETAACTQSLDFTKLPPNMFLPNIKQLQHPKQEKESNINNSQLEPPTTEQKQALVKSVPNLMDEQPQISIAREKQAMLKSGGKVIEEEQLTSTPKQLHNKKTTQSHGK